MAPDELIDFYINGSFQREPHGCMLTINGWALSSSRTSRLVGLLLGRCAWYWTLVSCKCVSCQCLLAIPRDINITVDTCLTLCDTNYNVYVAHCYESPLYNLILFIPETLAVDRSISSPQGQYQRRQKHHPATLYLLPNITSTTLISLEDTITQHSRITCNSDKHDTQ